MVKNKIVIILLILSIFIAYPFSRTFSFKSFITKLNLLRINGIMYRCDDNKLIKTVMENSQVAIYLSDDRTFILNRTLSASGNKYINKDKNIVFWSKGKTAFFQENNSITYSNCIEK